MALSYPGQDGTLWEVITRDSFLDAFSDQSLKVGVLAKDPTTLYEALKLVCRIETTARSPPEDDYDDLSRQRDKFARSLAEAESTSHTDLDRRIERLKSMLREYRQRTEPLPIQK